MNTPAITAAIDKITDSLYAIATLVLETDSVGLRSKAPIYNSLRDSALKADLYAAPVSTAQDVVIQALFNNYVVYLEWDRPPFYGKQPPISALKDWAEKNGISSDAQTLWGISYAIWRDGHVGRPIFATLDKEVDTLYKTEWADGLFASITDDLDKLFND